MSDRLNDMKQYLLSLDINPEDKRYTMNFCKKNEYLEGLRMAAVSDLHEHVSTGYGNINSKICFVIKDEKSFKVIKPLIQEILDKFHINFWNIYVTFVNKTVTEYPKKYIYLINEIYAVRPNILYVFDKDEVMYNNIIAEFRNNNVPIPHKHFFVDVIKLSSSDTEIRKELWDSLKYLINYKEIES